MVEVAPGRKELEPFLLSGGGGKRKGNCYKVHPEAGDRGWLKIANLLDRLVVECNLRKMDGITTVAENAIFLQHTAAMTF